tara:strand:- start:446 stop:1204 length:759 start_codon:yes stop_codon:yes gene_type:complete
MLERVCQVSDHLIDAQSPEHFEERKSTGSMISVYEDTFFAELVAYQPALDILAELGYLHPRWSSGYVISKPPHSPPLFWHQDWLGWNEPISYTDVPQQLFLMYYLVDTDQKNGCLRVIAGSHRKRHALHSITEEAHADNWSRYTDPGHLIYQSVLEEQALPVQAGDLVIGDSRLLHGSYANRSHQRRTVITLWFHPDFDSSPEPIRAHLNRKQSRISDWPLSVQRQVQHLVPDYNGPREPMALNRIPNDRLK